jgi:hypothetical protein
VISGLKIAQIEIKHASVMSQLYADSAFYVEDKMVMLLMIIVMEDCKIAKKHYKHQLFLVFSH